MLNKIQKNENGITLIAVAITIVVLVLIAGASVIFAMRDNGVIKQSNNATLQSDLSEIKEKIELHSINKSLDPGGANKILYLNTDEVNNVLNDNKYKDKIGVYRNTLMYLDSNSTNSLGDNPEKLEFEVLNMNPEEFKYYIELGVLEDVIDNHHGAYIGRELLTSDFSNSIQIGTQTYGNGWFLIGNYTDTEKSNNTYGSDLKKLGITDMTHAPYLVNYNTGDVLSIDGMTMYKADIQVHSFTDLDAANKLASALTYVDSLSENSGNYYGNLHSTSLYTGSVDNKKADYSDNNGNLLYDEDGALLLDSNNAIPVLSVNQKYKIDDAYSVSVTLEGDIYQSCENGDFPGSILALSDDIGEYITWIGFYKGYLHVYSFRDKSHKDLNTSKTETGFASIDISKYANQPMNIQLVSTRSAKTKVYVNGELISTFNSGTKAYTYKHLTLGDLRVGRNLKFTGKIYNFALFGMALTEDQVQSNYIDSQRYLNISN